MYLSEETRRKISLANRGKPKPPRSEEHCRNLSVAFKGRTFTDRLGEERAKEVREKISRSNLGKHRIPRSKEWRENLSRSLIGRSVWNKGKKGLQRAWNKIDISKDKLYEEYVSNKKIISDITKTFGVSKYIIFRAIREYNLPRRTSTELVRGKTYEEIYGFERARELRFKAGNGMRGKKNPYAYKISNALKEYYKTHTVSTAQRAAMSRRAREVWKSADLRKRVSESHKRYLREHPEELLRLKKIQYPGKPSSIEVKVRAFLNQSWKENKDFYFDKYEKTKKTYYRPDFQFPDKNIIIELDGHYNHFTEEGKKRDKIREEALKDVGWQVYRFTQAEIDNDFEAVTSKLTNILNQNGKDDCRIGRSG